MAITPSDLTVQWSTNFQTLFLTEFNQTVAVDRATLANITMEIPLPDHRGNKIQLDWLGAAPQMAEWTDEKKALGLGKHEWSATVKSYQASIEVDLNAINDAMMNPYEPRIREMAQNAGRLRYNLISDLLQAGDAAGGECYDGQYFFDTDHSEGDSGSQSNKLTGAGTSQANIETDFYAASAALYGFLDDKGVPLAPSVFRPLVWIPNSATLIQRFRTLQGATVISQTNNVLANSFDIVVDPRLTDATDWYMFRTNGMLKPFLFVNREEANYRDNFAALVGDPFERRVGKASVEARGVATYGMWQQAVQVVNS